MSILLCPLLSVAGRRSAATSPLLWRVYEALQVQCSQAVAVLTSMPGMQHHILKSFRRRLKKSSHGSKSQGSQEGMTDIVQMEELEEAERQAAKPAWKTKQFWRTAIPILVSVVLLVVGTVLGAKHYQRQVCVYFLLHMLVLTACNCQHICVHVSDSSADARKHGIHAHVAVCCCYAVAATCCADLMQPSQRLYFSIQHVHSKTLSP